MTPRDFGIKWIMYTLGLLPILLLQLFVLPWFPPFDTVPLLLPAAAVTLAVLEGAAAGAGFGLAVGFLSDIFIPGTAPGTMTLLLCLLGMGVGIVARYGIRQNLLGCILCSAAALAIIDCLRAGLYLLLGRAGLRELLTVVLPEILLTLVFVPLIYAIFRWIHRRVPRASIL